MSVLAIWWSKSGKGMDGVWFRQTLLSLPFDCDAQWIVWEPKMCRLAWQLLGLLGNVLGLLGMLCNVLGMPWQRPRHACNVLGLLGMLPARS